MADVFSKARRSEIMGRIRSKDTRPELVVRRSLHRAGLRYSLHRLDLPGKPDIVLRKYGCIVQVRGCFWHGHTCKGGHMPASNAEYWVPKILRTRARDRRNDRLLRKAGWRVYIVWECKLANSKKRESVMNALIKKIVG